MKRIFVVGGVSFNTMIYMNEFPEARPHTVFSRDYRETVGSTGAGKALNLTKLNTDITLHGLVGDDRYGDAIRAFFAVHELDFIHDIDDAGTERHVNLMNGRGDRISIYLTYGSEEPLLDMDRMGAYISDCDYLVLNIINYCRALIPIARQHNKDIWTDIHDYDGQEEYHQDFIDAASYVFMSSDQMPEYKPFMEKLIAEGKKLVVCTHGRNGSTALTEDGRWYEEPIIIDYLHNDSNGAGDAYFAGFLYGHSLGYPVRKCMRLGSIVSGLCITSYELFYTKLTEQKVQAEYDRHFSE